MAQLDNEGMVLVSRLKLNGQPDEEICEPASLQSKN
jgi:hypothetical protein